MGADALGRFLLANRYAVLATSRPDGRPQANPIAFFTSRGCFWFATGTGGRLRNLRVMPYGSLVISEGEGSAHRALIAEGPITIHQRRAELDALWAERHGRTPSWAAAFLKLRPERLFTFAAK
jgi:nitroimidazol reductase NimA-like FMN-containing flavoprotein (pyridoxamine 5'-phosphate oxidase superfamily)